MRSSARKSFRLDHRAWLAIVTFGLSVAACESAVSPVNDVGITGTVFLGLGNEFGTWSAPALIEPAGGPFNTASVDGCPFISPDGKAFYLASNRPGGVGGLDIWVSRRASVDDPWGAPENMGERVNSDVDDFCPTMTRDGKLLYFVSRRAGCGQTTDSDVYFVRLAPDARLNSDRDLPASEMLPCDDSAPYDAVNSPSDEFSPFPQLDPGVGPVLYFSSFRPGGFAVEPAGGAPDSDLYRSVSRGGVFGAAELIPAVNTAVDDGQPNVGNNGRELFFYSTRAGGVGAADLYVSTRAFSLDAWSTPVNLGAVNSVAAETRPSLSWDGLSLYFGSTRSGGEGATDIYVSTRQRLNP